MSLVLVLGALLLSAPSDSDFWDRFAEIDKLCTLGGPQNAKQALKHVRWMERRLKEKPDADWKLCAAWSRARCEGHLDQTAKAIEILEDALCSCPDGTHPLMFYVRRDLGRFYLHSGELRKAKPHLDWARTRAAEFLETPVWFKKEKLRLLPFDAIKVHLLYASCLLNLGEKDAAAARKEYQAIQAEIAKLPDRRQRTLVSADCLGALGELDMRNHDAAGCIAKLRKCLELLQSLGEERIALQRQFNCRLGLARTYRLLTRFRDATTEVDAADKLLPEKTERNRAALESARAALLVEEITCDLEADGEPDPLDALERSRKLERAQKLARAVVGHSMWSKFESACNNDLLARVDELRGRVLARAGKAEQAADEYRLATAATDRAIEQFSSSVGRDHDVVLHMRRRRARLNLRLGKHLAARKEAGEVAARFAEKYGKTHVDLGEFLHLQLEVELQDKAEGDERRRQLKAAAVHAEQHRELSARQLPYIARLTAAEQIKFFRLWDRPGLHSSLRLGLTGEPGLQEASANWLINGKAKVAEVMGRINQQGRDSKEYKDMQRSVRRQAWLLHGRPGGNDRDLRDQLLAEEANQRKLAEGLPGLKIEHPYTQTQLRQALSDDEVYIDVFCLRPRENDPPTYHAWVMTRKDPPRIVELGKAAILDKHVKYFEAHMQGCALPDNKDVISALGGPKKAEQVLHEKCLAPLSELVLNAKLWKLAGGKKRWIVSPAGSLWNVPWGALLLPPDKTYAVEKITFRYAISGRDLIRKQAKQPPRAEAWVLADPDVDHPPDRRSWTQRSRRLPRLPGAGEEGAAAARCLERLFKITARVQPNQVTKDEFLKFAKPPRFVYLATHGFFSLPTKTPNLLADNPLLRCGIAFAGYNYLPNGKGKPAESLPGLLTGAEVLAANLAGTELVVLSACESGRGEADFGQSPADLRHAFHLAGARAVVSSLWNVEDEATEELMVQFLTLLAANGTDKAAALNEAQRKRIREFKGSRDRHAHPYFWAGFTLSGS